MFYSPFMQLQTKLEETEKELQRVSMKHELLRNELEAEHSGKITGSVTCSTQVASSALVNVALSSSRSAQIATLALYNTVYCRTLSCQ